MLTASKELADWFEAAVAVHRSPKALANWIMGDVLRVAAESAGDAESDFSSIPMTPQQLGELVAMIEDDTISGKIAKTVFQKMVGTSDSPRSIVEREGLVQVTDEGAIAAVVDRIVAANQEKVAEYRSGKDKLFGFFVGQVIEQSGGRGRAQGRAAAPARQAGS